MRLRLCLLLAASAVCAAEQMAHMHQQELQSEQSFETPVPHVMTHHHGVPITPPHFSRLTPLIKRRCICM